MSRQSSKRLLESGLSPPPTKRKLQSGTTSNAVLQFFTPASKKVPEKTTWRVVHDVLLVGQHMLPPNPASKLKAGELRKIAGFDLDSTLIKPRSGNKFSESAEDWQWWHPVVPGCLKGLASLGFQIVVFTNQGGFSLKGDPKSIKAEQRRLNNFKTRCSSVMSQFDFPITVYAATGKTAGIYRKPRTGMWSEMLGDLDLDERGSIDMAASFFVGDAAGRPSEGGKGKDFSCSDRDLAANIGINFLTPEEYFTKEDPRTFIRNFEPESYLETIPTLGEDCPPPFARKNALEIVVFCGRPAAGKSSFYWKYLEPLGYERVNQDLLKTRERCLESALQHLAEGKSVAVDNTNADRDTRIKWIQLGAKKGASVRCLKFTASTDICKHNNIVRGLNGPLMNPEGRPILPMLALVGYASRYQEPSLEEGFQDITAVDFKFSGSEQQRAVWKRYWI